MVHLAMFFNTRIHKRMAYKKLLLTLCLMAGVPQIHSVEDVPRGQNAKNFLLITMATIGTIAQFKEQLTAVTAFIAGKDGLSQIMNARTCFRLKDLHYRSFSPLVFFGVRSPSNDDITQGHNPLQDQRLKQKVPLLERPNSKPQRAKSPFIQATTVTAFADDRDLEKNAQTFIAQLNEQAKRNHIAKEKSFLNRIYGIGQKDVDPQYTYEQGQAPDLKELANQKMTEQVSAIILTPRPYTAVCPEHRPNAMEQVD